MMKVTDPKGPEKSISRTARGSSWYHGTKGIFSFHRGKTPPSYRSETIGLRIICHDRNL